MKAERELDALVAEKVMGWEIIARGHRVRRGDDQFVVRGFADKEDCRRYIMDVCPPYSTDIAAAWEVVEKSSSFDIGYVWMTGKWRCNIRFRGGMGRAIAKTPELAICRAALDAKGRCRDASRPLVE